MTDPIALVTEATAPGKFDVLSAAKGRSYPQDIVDVYTDAEAAYQVNVLGRKIANHRTDDDELAALVAEQDALKETVKASVLTFRLRGINPGMIQSIVAQADAKYPAVTDVGTHNEWSNFSITAAHIVDVTDAAGNVDDHKWTVEEVYTLREYLPDSEFDKINDLVVNLSFSAQLFDASVNADFS